MISIERLAFSILRDAVRNHVTDIHIVPRKKDTVIQFRYANHLVPRLHLPLEECDRLISHFKFTASMDIGEKRKPQSGSHSYEIAGQSIGLRFSTLPSRYSESLVIRILKQAAHIPFYQISLFPHMTLKMLALLKHAHGLIIFTGPTDKVIQILIKFYIRNNNQTFSLLMFIRSLRWLVYDFKIYFSNKL